MMRKHHHPSNMRNRRTTTTQQQLDTSRNQDPSCRRHSRGRTLRTILLGAGIVVLVFLCPSVVSLTSRTFPTISNMGQQQHPRSSSKQQQHQHQHQQQQQQQQQHQQQQPPTKTGSPAKAFPGRISAMGTTAVEGGRDRTTTTITKTVPFSVPATPGGGGGTERNIPRPPSSSSSSSSSLSSFAVPGATTAPASNSAPDPAPTANSATAPAPSANSAAAATSNSVTATDNLYSSSPPKASSQGKHNFAPVKASWKPATATSATETTVATTAAPTAATTAAPTVATVATTAATATATATTTEHNDSKTTNQQQQQQQQPKTKQKKFTLLPEFGVLSSELFGSLKSVGRGDESPTTNYHEMKKTKKNTFALPELFSTFSSSAQGTKPRPSPFSSSSSSSKVTAAAATTPTTMYSTVPPPKGEIPLKKSSRPKNYAPVQATWKTTPTTTGAADTLASATNKAQQQFDVFSQSFLPDFPEGFFSSSTSFTPSFTQNLSIQFPDLPALPTTIRVQEYSDEVQRRSAAIDHDIKQKVNAFTQQKEYKVGDITKAIIAKIAHDDFDPAEVTFFFRILIAVGADLSGFSAVLPVGGLIGLFGWSISMGIAERVTKTIAVETNKRINNTKSSDDEDDNDNETAATASSSTTGPASSLSAATYVPGDLTKRAVLEYTGKSSYAQGDLAQQASSVRTATDDDVGTPVDMTVLQELEACLSMEKELIQKLDRIQRGQ